MVSIPSSGGGGEEGSSGGDPGPNSLREKSVVNIKAALTTMHRREDPIDLEKIGMRAMSLEQLLYDKVKNAGRMGEYKDRMGDLWKLIMDGQDKDKDGGGDRDKNIKLISLVFDKETSPKKKDSNSPSRNSNSSVPSAGTSRVGGEVLRSSPTPVGSLDKSQGQDASKKKDNSPQKEERSPPTRMDEVPHLRPNQNPPPATSNIENGPSSSSSASKSSSTPPRQNRNQPITAVIPASNLRSILLLSPMSSSAISASARNRTASLEDVGNPLLATASILSNSTNPLFSATVQKKGDENEKSVQEGTDKNKSPDKINNSPSERGNSINMNNSSYPAPQQPVHNTYHNRFLSGANVQAQVGSSISSPTTRTPSPAGVEGQLRPSTPASGPPPQTPRNPQAQLHPRTSPPAQTQAQFRPQAAGPHVQGHQRPQTAPHPRVQGQVRPQTPPNPQGQQRPQAPTRPRGQLRHNTPPPAHVQRPVQGCRPQTPPPAHRQPHTVHRPPTPPSTHWQGQLRPPLFLPNPISILREQRRPAILGRKASPNPTGLNPVRVHPPSNTTKAPTASTIAQTQTPVRATAMTSSSSSTRSSSRNLNRPPPPLTSMPNTLINNGEQTSTITKVPPSFVSDTSIQLQRIQDKRNRLQTFTSPVTVIPPSPSSTNSPIPTTTRSSSVPAPAPIVINITTSPPHLTNGSITTSIPSSNKGAQIPVDNGVVFPILSPDPVTVTVPSTLASDRNIQTALDNIIANAINATPIPTPAVTITPVPSTTPVSNKANANVNQNTQDPRVLRNQLLMGNNNTIQRPSHEQSTSTSGSQINHETPAESQGSTPTLQASEEGSQEEEDNSMELDDVSEEEDDATEVAEAMELDDVSEEEDDNDDSEEEEILWGEPQAIENAIRSIYINDDFGPRKDVTFKVGEGDKLQEIHAHKTVVALFSPVLDRLLFPKDNCPPKRRQMVLSFPDVDPTAFRTMIGYFYTHRFCPPGGVSTMEHHITLLELCRRFQAPESLMCKVRACVRAEIKNEDVLLILNTAVEMNEESLKLAALRHIERNAPAVLSYDGTHSITTLSKEAISEILRNDNLMVDSEIVVFHTARRWAEAKIRSRLENQDVKISPKDIRDELGDLLKLIRFPCIQQQQQFAYIVTAYAGLLDSKEVIEVYTWRNLKDSIQNNLPSCSFPTIARGVPSDQGQQSSSTQTQNQEEMAPPRPPPRLPSDQASHPGSARSTPVSGNDDEASNHSSAHPEDNPPPPKRPRRERSHSNAGSSVSGSFSTGTSERINDAHMNNLEEAGDSRSSFPEGGGGGGDDSQSSFPEAAAGPSGANNESNNPNTAERRRSIPALPLHSVEEEVYMREHSQEKDPRTNWGLYNELSPPKLLPPGVPPPVVVSVVKEDKLVILTSRSMYFPLTLADLKEFRVNYLYPCKNNPKTFLDWLRRLDIKKSVLFFRKQSDLLSALWDSGINISITVNGIKVLEIGENTLVISSINQAADPILQGLKHGIVDSLHELHRLYLDDVSIESLHRIPTTNLRSLTLRKVKGLKDRVEFLKRCKSLKEFLCNDMGKEKLDIAADFGFLEENGEGPSKILKLGLGRAVLEGSMPLRPLNDVSLIEELYLDYCTFSSGFVEAIPLIFPNLRKVKIYKNVTFRIFQKLLEIPSLEWIGIWEMKFPKNKNPNQKRGRGPKASPADIERLTEIFINAGIDDRQWFRGNTKRTFVLEKDPEARIWISTTETGDQFYAWTKMDFEHFGWYHFYKSFDLFYTMGK